jgi:two-component system sensor histidine kinase TctE
LAWIGVRRGIRPLLRLSNELQARPRGDLQPINPRLAPAEIAPLVRDFNTLITNARTENERRQRFIDNAAHQLRTPLAGLSLTTDLALRANAVSDKDAALKSISTAAQRASNAVTQLLMLTRAEHGESLARSPVELRGLLQTVLADYVSAAAVQNIDLGMQDETALQPMSISADAVLLREMLTNLLDNALRHTPAGGMITVSVREVLDPGTAAPFAEIDIEDSGKGIPSDERDKVFERFYRGSNPSKSGTGLGLAIVREIAAVHGGQVAFIEPGELGGAHARIRVPLKRPLV